MSDEAWEDPDLVIVRNELIQAALRRDTAAMRPNLEPAFLSSFGGDGGIDEFLGSLHSAGDWNEFVEVLSMGGQFASEAHDSFIAPTWFRGYSCDDSAVPATTTADTTEDRESARFSCDGFENLIVFGTNVRVRQAPGGTPIDAITLGVVALDRRASETRSSNGERWTPVLLPNGKSGWIASRLLRSVIGHRANFVKGSDGKWRLRSFVAGD